MVMDDCSSLEISVQGLEEGYVRQLMDNDDVGRCLANFGKQGVSPLGFSGQPYPVEQFFVCIGDAVVFEAIG